MVMGLIADTLAQDICVFMRFIDAQMCFPPILMALVVAGILGSGLKNVVIAIGISLIPAYARLMCARSLLSRKMIMYLQHVLPGQATCGL